MFAELLIYLKQRTSTHTLNICIASLSDISTSNISNVQCTHACRCNKASIVWLCACTGDNPRAKARGLSSRTYAQTIK